MVSQFFLALLVFDEILFFELGFASRKYPDKIERNTVENYKRIFCFGGINEAYWDFDSTLQDKA